MKPRLVILSGAGISAESGIKTFRDANGLWEGHDIMEVASPQGWNQNPKLVLDFYNQRRAQLKTVSPNKAHRIIAELENHFNTTIITQNVDDLHERAGSSRVIHLHGELKKVRGEYSENEKINWNGKVKLGDTNKKGEQLRPAIVWFGEAVPEIEHSIPIIQQANILIVIGTSLQVYPAAGLLHYVKPTVPIYYIDINPATIYDLPNPLEVFPVKATIGMEKLIKRLV